MQDLCKAINCVCMQGMVPEREMRIVGRTVCTMAASMCEVQLKDWIRANNMMLMLGLNETINQLAMANSKQ